MEKILAPSHEIDWISVVVLTAFSLYSFAYSISIFIFISVVRNELSYEYLITVCVRVENAC